MSLLNNNTKKLLVLVIIFCIVASGLFIYFEFLSINGKVIEIEEVKEIDDRISPLENQGLILEVIRIRHRGLLEKMMKRGLSWRVKPEFYYISNMDGLEYISKDVEAAGGASTETLFNGWDTIFQENMITKDVEEEQKTSEISLTIVERVKKGIFGLRSKDVEREKIKVIYDYRTGHWTGDDYLHDEDGYGHYIGETFEVWFNLYQTDKDRDKIPYWTEVNVFHTDPLVDDSRSDFDLDGIPTTWEWKWGYDPNTWDDHKNLDPDLDGIENIEEYQMERWFSNPFSQDIYIEVDEMEKGGLFDWKHELHEEAKQIIIERFSQHGINVYIDDGWPGGPVNGGGETLPHYVTISQDSGMMLQFYRNHFSKERIGIFRYCVIGHNAGFCIPSEFNRYDTLAVGTSPKKTYINRMAFTKRTQCLVLASSIMHETGHSLGISPWSIQGCDNVSFANGRAAKKHFLATWGDYQSVMNYYYIFNKNIVDYSDGSNGPPYDQNDWLNIYLPHFQNEDVVIEEPFFDPPGLDKMVIEEIDLALEGWAYDENLTKKYIDNINGWSPVDPIDCDWRVLVKFDNVNTPSIRNIRIYAQPKVPYSEWILVNEGELNSDGKIDFYLNN